MCKSNSLRGRTHAAVCARPWFRTAEPLGERRNENWITTNKGVENSVSVFIQKHEHKTCNISKSTVKHCISAVRRFNENDILVHFNFGFYDI